MYKSKGENKKISIFEPNISIMKWCFPAILVCENAYRIKNNIAQVYITNVHKEMNKSNINTFNLDNFNKILISLDLMKDKKLSIEKRFNTLNFMDKFSEFAVSHQWENPLNYLYLDLAWMGWPIIHNAHLCKDIGYYYEGFNYEMGGQVLQKAIEEHEKNVDEYIKNNRAAIDRYLPSNKNLQEKYMKLINNLYDIC
jgi:hypothetical protein